MIDLGGDVRTDPRLSGTKHNVFGIQIGVAISLMVKRAKAKGCRIRYSRRPQLETAEEKLAYLRSATLEAAAFEEIRPNARSDWINQTKNHFDALLHIAHKETKSTRITGQETAVFKLFSFGVVTNRDEWVYADDTKTLAMRIRFLIDAYNSERERLAKVRDRSKISEMLSDSIKWTRSVKNNLQAGVVYQFDSVRMVEAVYRPYTRRVLYFSSQLNEMQYMTRSFFGDRAQLRRKAIAFTDPTSQKPFMALAIDRCPDMHLVGAAAGTVTVGRERIHRWGGNRQYH